MSDELLEEPVHRLFAMVPHLLCVTDADGVVRQANPAAAGVLGVAPRLVGLAIPALVMHADAETARRAFRDLSDSSPAAAPILRFPRPGAGSKHVQWMITRDPESDRRYASAWDVTEKEVAEARCRAAAEASPSALVMVDTGGRIVLLNRAAERLLGFARDELIGRPVEVLVPEPSRREHEAYRQLFRDEASARPIGRGRDLAVLRKDGTVTPVEIGLSPVDVDGELLTVAALVDLTERERARERIETLARELREANRELEWLAGTDGLTGLWNRRKFEEESGRLLRLLQQTGDPFSLILVDVDDFKEFNDRFGHGVGDHVLRRVAAALGHVRTGADCIARYGGEEFVLGLPGTGREGALALAERLRESVHGLAGEGGSITISAGVATLADAGARGTPVEPLLARLVGAADRALYASKLGGKNRVTWGEEP